VGYCNHCACEGAASRDADEIAKTAMRARVVASSIRWTSLNIVLPNCRTAAVDLMKSKDGDVYDQSRKVTLTLAETQPI